MSNFNYNFITTNLEYLWSFKVSEDGKTALIGFGDDEGQLTQFDIEKKEVSKSYWTEGSYTGSIEFLSNSKAIIGTSNGFVLLIDLERKEILDKKQISSKSIKDLKFSDNKKIIFAITSSEILAFDIDSLDLITKRELNFNPWHIVLIPHTTMLTVEGSNLSVEIYNYSQKEFVKIDSAKYGSSNEDMISLSFNEKNRCLIGSSEVGNIYIWYIASRGLDKPNIVDFKEDEISWLQSHEDYIVFSTLRDGASFINMSEKKIINIPKSKKGEIIKLKEINDKHYLLYLTQDGISLADIGNNDLEIYSVNDLPYGIRFIDFTSNGDIIAVTSEGIIVSNFLNSDEEINIPYDFNSKEKNIAVENFIFNEVDESIALQCKDESIKVLSLVDANISDINFSSNDIYGLELKDFYRENILLSSYKDIYIVNSKTSQSKEIMNKDEDFPSIKQIKLVSENKYAIVNNSDYMVTPIVWDYLKVYNFDGKEVHSQKLKDIFSSIFISGDKLVTTYINSMVNSPSEYKASKIINLSSNEIREFDIGYCFKENDGTMLFNNEQYCIRIAIGSQFNHCITCYNLMSKDDNGDAKVMWKNEAPWLSSFKPLGYCEIDGYFYIVNEDEGEIISLDISNGDMISSCRVQKNIVDIKMSNSGKYVAWRLETGEFSYISYPFKSCEVSDE